jgi:hypothetical protein
MDEQSKTIQLHAVFANFTVEQLVFFISHIHQNGFQSTQKSLVNNRMNARQLCSVQCLDILFNYCTESEGSHAAI